MRKTARSVFRENSLVGALEDIPREWLKEFEAEARRPLEQRMR